MFHKKAKTTKKIVLRVGVQRLQAEEAASLKRCKHFELGYA